MWAQRPTRNGGHCDRRAGAGHVTTIAGAGPRPWSGWESTGLQRPLRPSAVLPAPGNEAASGNTHRAPDSNKHAWPKSSSAWRNRPPLQSQCRQVAVDGSTASCSRMRAPTCPGQPPHVVRTYLGFHRLHLNLSNTWWKLWYLGRILYARLLADSASLANQRYARKYPMPQL